MMAANDNKRPDYEGYTREKKELDKLALHRKSPESTGCEKGAMCMAGFIVGLIGVAAVMVIAFGGDKAKLWWASRRRGANAFRGRAAEIPQEVRLKSREDYWEGPRTRTRNGSGRAKRAGTTGNGSKSAWTPRLSTTSGKALPTSKRPRSPCGLSRAWGTGGSWPSM